MTRGRTPTTDGYITVGVKLRQSLAARLDEARGGTSRSEYLRRLLLNDLEPLEDTKALTAKLKQRVIDDQGGGCPHPKARRSKGGLCMACGENVGDLR